MGSITIYIIMMLSFLRPDCTPETSRWCTTLALTPFIVTDQITIIEIGCVALAAGVFDETTAHPRLAWIVFGSQLIMFAFSILRQVLPGVLGI